MLACRCHSHSVRCCIVTCLCGTPPSQLKEREILLISSSFRGSVAILVRAADAGCRNHLSTSRHGHSRISPASTNDVGMLTTSSNKEARLLPVPADGSSNPPTSKYPAARRGVKLPFRLLPPFCKPCRLSVTEHDGSSRDPPKAKSHLSLILR
ncbi:hypothetical protein NDU88_008216 [Pleurodeles waltl]|uniref:Uncharacterized protein n=1 Tax=Pleurodeles waltl TaxID=8319 RepID=A0AAV7U2P7_PLEWA|nr:hypothetical protein NDU88_008216 [Pleurodeles waltl]